MTSPLIYSQYTSEVLRKTGEYNTYEERPDYDKCHYCNNCKRNKPKTMSKCDECSQFLRRRPVRKVHLELPRY